MVNKNFKAPKIFKEGFVRFYMKKERFFLQLWQIFATFP
jgi:hypothetical protein